MTEAAAGERGESKGDSGLLMRGYRAVELLVSAHAKQARQEAEGDLRRVMGGVLLLVVAFALLMFALTLGHAAAVVGLQWRFQWGYPACIGAVAGADVFIAWVLFAMARARLKPPVLAETREVVKKAAAVLRG